MEKLTNDQLYKVALFLQAGHYGSFMSAIGCALQAADSGNLEKLYQAFGDKFERVYAQAIMGNDKRTMKYFAKAIRKNVDGKPDYEFVHKQANGCPIFFETEKQALNAAKALCENPALAMYDPQVGVVRE